MTEEVKHYQVGQKYKVMLERAASTKGQDGFRVEVNSDTLPEVTGESEALYAWAKVVTAKGGELNADKTNPVG